MQKITKVKSIESHKVLMLMDEGITYEQALKIVLEEIKKELEKNLNYFI